MSYTYAEKKRSEKPAPNTEELTVQGPSLDALRSGAAAPTAEQMGHRVDLPDAMREKMESAFGADLSAVKLYESEAVADAGANAITQGANVAFAPGMLDFTSYGGQALLGHEISHVVSQARGEVTGGGFLNDASLEARADREGALAAAGEQIGMPYTAVSPVSAAAAAGPMQASKGSKKLLNAETLTPEMIQKAKLKDLRREDVQDRVLRDYVTNLNSDIVANNDSDLTTAKSNFRDNAGVSKKVYNEMLARLVEPHARNVEKQALGMDGMERVDAAGTMLADAVEQDASLSHMIAGAKAAFTGSTHFADETSQGELLMNNFMLRAVTPLSYNAAATAKTPERSTALRNYSRDLQRATNQNMTGADVSRMAHDTVLSGSSGMRRLLGTAQRLWARGDAQAPGGMR